MTDASAGDSPLHQLEPIDALFEADPAEANLRALYAHSPGVTRLGLIASRDGKASGPDGSTRSLNSDADLRILRALRATADVVVVGANTARVERYGPIALAEPLRAARREGGLTDAPAIAIVTYTGAIPAEVNPTDAWVLTSEGSPATRTLGDEWRERTITAGDDTFRPGIAIEALAERGMRRVLLEGGPRLAVQFMDAGLIGEYCLTTSPERGDETGAEVPPVPRTMTRAHRLVAGDYTMDRWVE